MKGYFNNHDKNIIQKKTKSSKNFEIFSIYCKDIIDHFLIRITKNDINDDCHGSTQTKKIVDILFDFL